ncbi:MAG: hypothetical protein IJA94_04230 [Bacilli bacterium]|nr:hypothetical protein [Bacilli bacterium]
MKKIFLSLFILVMTTTLCGCEKTETIKDTITTEKEIIVDYSSSTSFENAVNKDEKVKGKIVKVLVLDTIEVIENLTKFKTGNNLIFSCNEKIDISKEDYVVVRILDEPEKIDNNFQVKFEFIKLYKNKENITIDNNEKEESNITEDNTNNDKKIKMIKESSNYIGLDKTEVEKEFKEKGFSYIELVEKKTSDSNNKNNSIYSITINNKEFIIDEEFSIDDKVIITYWKYEKPVSEYELAFIRDMSNYDLYYMFDTDTKKVVYFGTNDTYIENGMYSGEFNTGVTINWLHGEWTEKFINKDSSNTATLIDGNNFEWKYEKCEVSKAQKILDNLK